MTLVQSELKNIYIWRPTVSSMQWPAPDCFHVPSKDEHVALVDAMTALWIDTSNGNCMKTYLKMPFAGRRGYSSSALQHQGTNAYYWSSTAYGEDAHYLVFNSAGLYPQSGYRRPYGCSVRCFKNTPTIPASSWTTLFDWSSIAIWAWIFHNTTDWLISISADWINWITIQDKNLWATVVYNDWDTLSQANCGNYYQWGNNYGFPWTWSVTTSSTKVDASGYGPWNYYSSSTFITPSTFPFDWSSVQNDNLRWWVYTPIKRITIRPNGTEKQIRPTTVTMNYVIENIPTNDANAYVNVSQSWMTIQSVKFNFTVASATRYASATISSNNSTRDKYQLLTWTNNSWTWGWNYIGVRWRLSNAWETYWRYWQQPNTTYNVEWFISRDGNCYLKINDTTNTYTAWAAELNVIQTVMNLSNMNVYASQVGNLLSWNKEYVEVEYL